MENIIQPSDKAPSIDAMLTSVFGVDRVKTISGGTCVSCDAEGIIASSFSDDLSRKEYSISGMCQSCQNDIFGLSDEDEDDEDWDDEQALASAGFGMDESYNDGGAYREDFGYFGEMGMMED